MGGGEDTWAICAGVGGSTGDWFVSPRHTVVVNRDVIEGCSKLGGVSLSLSLSDSKSKSSLNASSDPAGEASGEDAWLVKPFHIVTFSRAPRPNLSPLV